MRRDDTRNARSLVRTAAIVLLLIAALLLVYNAVVVSVWFEQRFSDDGFVQQQQDDIDDLKRLEQRNREAIRRLQRRPQANVSDQFPCVACGGADNQTVLAQDIDTLELNATSSTSNVTGVINADSVPPVPDLGALILNLTARANSITNVTDYFTCPAECSGVGTINIIQLVGAWNATRVYEPGQVTTYLEDQWLSVTGGNVGQVPGSNESAWGVYADNGKNGTDGAQGALGNTGGVGAQGALGNTGALGSTGAQGALGNTGAVGATGAAGSNASCTCVNGSTGATGGVGATGAQGPVGVQPQQPWSSLVTYSVNDIVRYQGQVYLANASSLNQTPSNTSAFWALYVDVGVGGATGAQGLTGASVFVSQIIGPWNATANYSNGDVVTFQNMTYISLVPGNIAQQPDLNISAWAAIGTPGMQGATGNTGAPGFAMPVVTLASYVQPAVGASVQINASLLNVQGGQQVLVVGAGYYTVVQGSTQQLSGYALFNATLLNASDALVPSGNTVPVTSVVLPSVFPQAGGTGAQGAVGNTGAQGALGNTGALGALGNTGSQGALGNTGAIGNTGAQGALGNTGAQGALGNTGAQGALGNTGALGDTGAQGALGNTGAQGALGNTGAVGNTGSQGALGNTGAQGALGNTGAIGNTGSQGALGNTGAVGALGNTGATGSVGANGTTTIGTQASMGASFCVDFFTSQQPSSAAMLAVSMHVSNNTAENLGKGFRDYISSTTLLYTYNRSAVSAAQASVVYTGNSSACSPVGACCPRQLGQQTYNSNQRPAAVQLNPGLYMISGSVSVQWLNQTTFANVLSIAFLPTTFSTVITYPLSAMYPISFATQMRISTPNMSNPIGTYDGTASPITTSFSQMAYVRTATNYSLYVGRSDGPSSAFYFAGGYLTVTPYYVLSS